MTERLTAADFLAQQAAPRRKYGNEPVTVQGIKFDSAREARRWIVLRDDENKGRIRDLKLQVPFRFIIGNTAILTDSGKVMEYRADFTYFTEPDGEFVVEDSKGHRTKEYKIKAAIMRAMGYPIKEV